jgi:Cysteinyl-tRNA synthetase
MSNIQVFNTLTGKKETFTPSPGNRVTMYACGPTVYDLSHLGHARMSIVWDVVQRYLRFSGFDVTYVRNITDVDDKIIRKAEELGTTPERVAREFTYTFWNDMHALNVDPPDYEPRATEFIERMIKFTQDLIAAGHAYVSGNDVYFDVSSFKEYGKLSKKTSRICSSAHEIRSAAKKSWPNAKRPRPISRYGRVSPKANPAGRARGDMVVPVGISSARP